MSEPAIVRIEEVKLVNTDKGNSDIKSIDYEGEDLLSTDEVKSHTSGSYVMRGFKAKVKFENELFDVAVNTSNTMSYLKIEDANNYDKAERLHDILRERYLSYFR